MHLVAGGEERQRGVVGGERELPFTLHPMDVAALGDEEAELATGQDRFGSVEELETAVRVAQRLPGHGEAHAQEGGVDVVTAGQRHLQSAPEHLLGAEHLTAGGEQTPQPPKGEELRAHRYRAVHGVEQRTEHGLGFGRVGVDQVEAATCTPQRGLVGLLLCGVSRICDAAAASVLVPNAARYSVTRRSPTCRNTGENDEHRAERGSTDQRRPRCRSAGRPPREAHRRPVARRRALRPGGHEPRVRLPSQRTDRRSAGLEGRQRRPRSGARGARRSARRSPCSSTFPIRSGWRRSCVRAGSWHR